MVSRARRRRLNAYERLDKADRNVFDASSRGGLRMKLERGEEEVRGGGKRKGSQQLGEQRRRRLWSREVVVRAISCDGCAGSLGRFGLVVARSL